MAALTLTSLASLSLPAGKYVIFAKAWFDGDPTGSTDTVDCRLRAESDFDVSDATAYKPLIGTPDQPQALTTNLVHEYSAAGTADFVCGSTAAVNAHNVVLTAIKVASLTTG
jgi:hypothetical protein